MTFLLLLACGTGESTDETPPAPPAQPAPAPAPAKTDVCTLLPAAGVEKALGVTGVTTERDTMNLIGDFVGSCTYTWEGGKLFLTVQVERDGDNFKRLERMLDAQAKMDTVPEPMKISRIDGLPHPALGKGSVIHWSHEAGFVTLHGLGATPADALPRESLIQLAKAFE